MAREGGCERTVASGPQSAPSASRGGASASAVSAAASWVGPLRCQVASACAPLPTHPSSTTSSPCNGRYSHKHSSFSTQPRTDERMGSLPIELPRWGSPTKPLKPLGVASFSP